MTGVSPLGNGSDNGSELHGWPSRRASRVVRRDRRYRTIAAPDWLIGIAVPTARAALGDQMNAMQKPAARRPITAAPADRAGARTGRGWAGIGRGWAGMGRARAGAGRGWAGIG
ncbi:hypothetical protein GCM10010123_43430 [Pilimelia anulata]|uniref:Uncharacterized protein n=2 Tax=Pilimelia anulata TaxID=53371 RepID=A0A8J3BB17_9ACTN|nr:hypothetical protein GCM10010123_43430 [Pilimelia anulata]